MPPDDFSERTAHFITESGRVRTRAEQRAAIDKLIDHIKKESKRLAAQLKAGKITKRQFEMQMRELLKSGHIISSSVGKGGRARMTFKDWGKVGSKLAWQYRYLQRFTKKASSLSEAATVHRASLYASAVRVSYYNTLLADQKQRGAVKTVLGELPLMARRELNAAESCTGCIRESSEQFLPLDEIAEIGSQECGDYCLCEIIFNDTL